MSPSPESGRPFRAWDPFGVWRQLPSVPLPSVPLPSMPLSPVTSLPGFKTLVQTVVGLIRGRLLGRRLTVRTKTSEITLTLTDLDVPLGALGIAAGQLDDVRVTVEDVSAQEFNADRVVATLRNVHTRPGPPPVLVAAPVDLVLSLDSDAVAALVARHQPDLLLEVGADAVARLRWARRPEWGLLEVQGDVDGTTLRIRPAAVVVRGRRWQGVHRLPPWSVALSLPGHVRLITVELRPGGVDVHARLDEWRLPISGKAQEELIRRLTSAASVLDLSRWP